MEMSNLTPEVKDLISFWVTLLIVGMGGTLAALGILAVLMSLLKKMFPVKSKNA